MIASAMKEALRLMKAVSSNSNTSDHTSDSQLSVQNQGHTMMVTLSSLIFVKTSDMGMQGDRLP